MTKRTTKLLPWTGDDEAMLDWLADIIDAELKKVYEAESDADTEPDAAELAAARYGDLGPLSEKYPHLAAAGVLCLPPMGSRRTYAQARQRAVLDGYLLALEFDNKEHRAVVAANLVPMIRSIWARHFRRYYRKKTETSAEWFAARLFDVEEADVLKVAHKGAGRARS